MLRGTGVRLRAHEHQYVYMDHSPYEVLGNNVLSYGDIIRIKQVEDVLEKYWNDHRMDTAIEYLVSNSFSSPFDFFQEFGSYWDGQGWSRIGHQLEDLYRRLGSFLTEKQVPDLQVIEGLMKYDYLKNHKYKPRKPWWNASYDKSRRISLYNHIINNPASLGESFVRLGLDEKDLYKHTMLEEISFDITRYLMTGTIVKQPSCLLAYFDPVHNQTVIFPFILP